jgi:hypothetical protein
MTDLECDAMRWFLTIVLFALTVSVSTAQESNGKCVPTYQDHNMIDYGPLVFRNLSGHDIDPYSVRMAGGCIGLFTEEDHRLVATTQTDQDGNFAFAKTAPGRYRLVVVFPGFCVANVPLRVVHWPRGGRLRRLVLHMMLGAIDTCSYGDYE